MTSDSPDTHPSGKAKSMRRTAIFGAALAGGMLGLAFAAVPLYDAFCRVTGFGGTPRVAASGVGEVTDRDITVRFDANVNRDLPWTFKPVQVSQTLKIGEQGLAFYETTNTSDQPVTGTATFNVTPLRAGGYFAKIECFCFQEQVLQPGQTVSMPVSYFIDPAILDDPEARDITTFTLSYTFFPVKAGS